MPVSNRSRDLAQTLGQAIRRGQWTVGQTLPPTRQIAREQHMSLATVQAGLRQLESAGLVERRPRRGIIVKSRLGRGFGLGGARPVQQIAVVMGGGVEWAARDGWANRIAHAAQMAMGRHDMQPAILRYDARVDSAQIITQRIQAFGDAMAGVIAFNGTLVAKLTPKLDEMGLPWVIINRRDARTIHNFVAADNLLGCRLLGECFARMGLRRVLVLMARGVNFSETEKEKITGLVHGFLGMEAPINGIDYILCGEDQTARGHVESYLREHEAPHAIFALNDDMASGAIAACVAAGLSVPGDVKIVGGAGVELALHTRPTLSVVAQPTTEMGREACDMLMQMVEKGRRRIERRRIKGKLILRESLPVPDDIRAELEKGYPGMVE
jgi:DNA-binding LacI/PurR family transcriptional regulator